MATPYYTLLQKAKMLGHPGAINQLGDVINDGGFKKAFLVYDQGVKMCGIIDKITALLKANGTEYVEFGEVLADPPSGVIDKGGELCRQSGCDCVIAIGGGSSIDTAKGITLLRVNGGKILDYKDAATPKKYSPGLICIPTTAGTGSELSQGIIVSDLENKQKVPMMAFEAMAEFIILDPELTVGMPAGLTLMTGLDVFSHAWESYVTPIAHPMSEIQSEKVMQEVIKYLPRVMKDGNDIEARTRMLMAASLGGFLLRMAATNCGHSIAHVIGAHFHIPHGAACAYGVPPVMRLIAKYNPAKIKYIGELFGVEFDGKETPEQIGEKTANAYIAFRDGLGLKPLSSYGVTKEQLVSVAKDVANEPFAPLTLGGMTEELAAQLLAECYY
ncbi:MAG: iron-containing alcohol dehydrogenase [archaeon]|nr:iron-containing alcohol dehydrogenase [archaeon]